MKVLSYGSYSQSDLELGSDDWELLTGYVGDIERALAAELRESGPMVERVEEEPPRIEEGLFKPGGWVGSYPPGVKVAPRTIAQDEYEEILGDVQRWIETIGATTIETALPLSADILVDSRARLGAFSEALIEYSEILLSHRLPVQVERKTNRGMAPRGRPLFSGIQQEMARGSQQLVTEDIRFSFESLSNLLLVRFHIEILNEMRSLAKSYEYYRGAFDHQIRYHDSFINEGEPSKLVDQAIQVDFFEPGVIDQVRQQATGTMAEVVDLWEAFQRNVGLEFLLTDNLNTAVKPMSKTYELWCLGMLIEIISEVVGVESPQRTEITGVYEFGSSVKLFYNRRIPRHSNYLGPAFEVGSGQPDYAIEAFGELVWISDAKFKTWDSLNLQDYQRFITYLVDFLTTDQVGTLLYVDDGPVERRQRVSDYTINHLSFRPENRERGLDALGEFFQTVL